MSQNSRNQGFSYYFCLMIEGSGSGSIPLTNGPGSGRPKNIRIRIRIRNTAFLQMRKSQSLILHSLKKHPQISIELID
jgi:hypothetical protein